MVLLRILVSDMNIIVLFVKVSLNVSRWGLGCCENSIIRLFRLVVRLVVRVISRVIYMLLFEIFSMCYCIFYMGNNVLLFL